MYIAINIDIDPASSVLRNRYFWKKLLCEKGGEEKIPVGKKMDGL